MLKIVKKVGFLKLFWEFCGVNRIIFSLETYHYYGKQIFIRF